MNETIVRISADATGYTSGLERAKKSAGDFLAAQDAAAARTAAAQKAIEEATTNASQASSRQINAFIQSIGRQAEAAGKSRAQLLEMKAATLGVSESAKTYIDKIAEASKHTEELNFKTAGARRELLVLAHEASQGNWTKFGGSLMVLGERVDAMSLIFSGAGAAAAAVAAAVGAVAIAAIKGAEDAKQFNAALVLTSNYAGLAAQSLQDMEHRVAAASGGSLGKANEVLLDLAKSGRYSSSEMESLSNVIIRTAQISGQSLEDVSKEYSKLADDPGKWAFEHNQSMHFMDTATYQHIRALEDAGDKHKAIQAVVDAATAQVADSSTKHLSTAARAWKGVTDSIDEYWQHLKRAASGNLTIQDQIDNLRQQRVGSSTGRFTTPQDIARIDKQIATLQEQQRLEQRAAESQARIAQISEAGIEATKRVEKVRDQVMTNAQRRQKELAQLAKDRAAILADHGTLSDADYAGLVAGINEKYKDKQPKHEKAYHDDEATRFLQQLRDKDAAIRADIEATGKKFTDAEKLQAEFLQKIADLKEKKVLTADQKSLLANQDAIKAQLALNVADERRLQIKQDALKLDERMVQLNAQMANYQQSQREQYGRQLDAIGMGSEAQKNAQAVKSIYREYEKLQAELDKATPKSQLGGEAYLAERQRIHDGLQQSLQDYTDYYDTLKAKQGDWTNGATQAIANYVDKQRDMMAQAEGVVTSAFKGMEDALTNFVMTGKLNFKSLADSIISEIVRIQMKQAVAGLAGMLGNMFMPSIAGAGAFGGAGAALSGGSTAPLAGDFFGTGGSVSSSFGAAGIFGGARASGGPVDAGKTYLVGEHGPELWTPQQSGAIVPNHALSGGNTVVNVSLVEDSSKAGQVDQKQNGSGVDLVAYVTQIAKRAVAGDLASGQGDISKALGARYGLTPRFR
ncbi:phage tail tape measure protein [Ralstonia pickettii]|uniref:phage tail tape measure protein n=1 Tax=Ralstonia pickettii TaxID=329 RepID=UPI001BE4C31C|nr:phage tail tape measure protein [Ralstonia pickettii]MBT2180994.1 phage tail tape measure protein [Ralstonia pickettii]